MEARILELKADGDGILKIGRKLGIGNSVFSRKRRCHDRPSLQIADALIADKVPQATRKEAIHPQAARLWEIADVVKVQEDREAAN